MGETSFPAGGGLRRLLVSVSDWREVAANYLGEPPHGGLVVEAPEDVAMGEPLELLIRCGDDEVAIRGAVLWKRRGEKTLLAGIGFLASEVEKREKLLGLTRQRHLADRARRQPRYRVAMRVTYRTATDFVVDYTRNISGGGVFVSSKRPPRLGEKVLLRLYPPGQDEPIDLAGQVAWRRPGEGFGLRFSPFSAQARQHLEKVVRSVAVGTATRVDSPIFEEVTPF
ncbi:MAG: hypothetical protein DRI34_02255 [Deltaproteobacteria bacterium]|nr:MAG: hypothetical protein DRI34_02255 [Deltaproteobacteria bacterium]